MSPSIPRRLIRAGDCLFEALRHEDAFTVAAEQGTASDLRVLDGYKHCLLTTFRRDGTPVPTVVWFGLKGRHVYVRTEERTGKLKRIRSNPHVRVAPCDIRGKPLGPTAEATARILGPQEADDAERVIRDNYSFPRQWFESGAERLGLNSLYIEISPGAPESANRRGERGKRGGH